MTFSCFMDIDDIMEQHTNTITVCLFWIEKATDYNSRCYNFKI